MGGFHSRTPGYHCPFCCSPRGDQLCWRSGLGASVAGTALLRGSEHQDTTSLYLADPKAQISVLEELERFLPQHRKQTVHCLHFKADCTTHKNKARGKYSPLFPDKTSIIHKSQMHFFSLFILGEETRFNCCPHLVHIHST